MKTFGDYHDIYIYIKADVLLLIDICGNFRSLCLDYYKLDPVHYYGTPGIAWDACLKMTKQQLELITDPDMYLFYERGKRGGMSFICHRYAEANNKYMENYLMYFDANSWAMCNPLPIGSFKWVDVKSKNSYMMKMTKEQKFNFMVECDIEYPDNLHDLHNDYPLAPEKIVI